MEIKAEKNNEVTVAFVKGEIDHHNARIARERLDEIIATDKPICFGLDLSGVTFCDSSGEMNALCTRDGAASPGIV